MIHNPGVKERAEWVAMEMIEACCSHEPALPSLGSLPMHISNSWLEDDSRDGDRDYMVLSIMTESGVEIDASCELDEGWQSASVEISLHKDQIRKWQFDCEITTTGIQVTTKE